MSLNDLTFYGSKLDQLIQHHLSLMNRKEKLKKQVFDLKKSIKSFAIKMENEIEKLQSTHTNERAKWQKQQQQLHNDLDEANLELTKALEEVSELNHIIEDLTKEVSTIITRSEKEMEDLKLNYATEIIQIKNTASEVQGNLEMVNSHLEQKLNEEKKKGEKLREEISRVQRQASEELIVAKQKANMELLAVKQDLTFHQAELNDRNNQIDELYEERSRVRSLTRLQFGLLKSRVVNKYRKIFRREKK